MRTTKRTHTRSNQTVNVTTLANSSLEKYSAISGFMIPYRKVNSSKTLRNTYSDSTKTQRRDPFLEAGHLTH
jgi:hypothetical protein